jgi:hypothetical protein
MPRVRLRVRPEPDRRKGTWNRLNIYNDNALEKLEEFFTEVYRTDVKFFFAMLGRMLKVAQEHTLWHKERIAKLQAEKEKKS